MTYPSSSLARNVPGRTGRRVRQSALTVACVCGALAPLFVGNPFIVHIGVMIGIMAIVAVSMNLMLRIGQLSLAQSAFMGIGAYGSALLSIRLGIPSLVSLLLGSCISAAIAFVLGPVFLRIRGVYFVLLTFAFGQIVNLIFQDWISLFGGNNGLGRIPTLSAFGFSLASVNAYYCVVLLLLALTAAVVVALDSSDVGAVLSTFAGAKYRAGTRRR
jgi:branched-chain amino acid transport system permease protein